MCVCIRINTHTYIRIRTYTNTSAYNSYVASYTNYVTQTICQGVRKGSDTDQLKGQGKLLGWGGNRAGFLEWWIWLNGEGLKGAEGNNVCTR